MPWPDQGLRCGAWDERRPVDALLKLFVGRKNVLESERELGWAVRFEMRDAFLGFVDAGSMSNRHPPQGHKDASKLLEPFVAVAYDFCVHAPVDEIFHGVDRLPHRHVQEDAIILRIRTKIGGIAFVR